MKLAPASYAFDSHLFDGRRMIVVVGISPSSRTPSLSLGVLYTAQRSWCCKRAGWRSTELRLIGKRPGELHEATPFPQLGEARWLAVANYWRDCARIASLMRLAARSKGHGAKPPLA